jgi:two-component system nitrate/nitrite response regulator NarP
MRVVLADDHPLVRSAIGALLTNRGCEVVAEVASGLEALAAVVKHDPDVLLLDVSMPDTSGVEVLQTLRQRDDHRLVVLVTAGLDAPTYRAALAAGANAIFLKSSDPELLLECLAAVQQGAKWLEPMLDMAATDDRLRRLTATLSPREIEVAELVAHGLRNREIAERLRITEGTVKVYLHTIFEKLQVRTRTELALLAGELLGVR